MRYFPRQQTIGSVEALPEIFTAIAEHCEVYLDDGI
jgi:hypothetical protein